MNKLLSKLISFSEKAKKGNIRVDIYIENQPEIQVDNSSEKFFKDLASKNNPVKSLILYACLIAGGAAIPTALQYQTELVRDKVFTNQIENSIKKSYLLEAATGDSAKDDEVKLPLTYVEVNYLGRKAITLDAASRIALVKEAAEAENLHQVGLSWKDLYAVINAETAWISRDGIGKNGVISYGLAQMEPNTASALGLKDPNDPRSAVRAAAMLIKEAGQWSARKISKLKLNPKDKAIALRDGVSIYYNLSTAARNQWDGENNDDLPVETINHIENSRDGSKIATRLEKDLLKATIAKERLSESNSSIQKVGYTLKLTGDTDSEFSKKTTFFQFSQKKVVADLQSILHRPCAVALEESTIVKFNSACAINKEIGSAGAVDRLTKLASSSMLVGEFKKTPVFLANSTELNAFAFSVTNPKDGSSNWKQGIGITTSLVEAIGNTPGSLEFILGHELGHIDHHHKQEDTPQDIEKNEVAADLYGINLLKDLGFTEKEITKAVTTVFSAIKKNHKENPDVISLIKRREDSIQAKFSTNFHSMGLDSGSLSEVSINLSNRELSIENKRIKDIQSILTNHCQLTSEKISIKSFNESCLLNKPNLAKIVKDGSLDKLFETNMLIGDISGVPVLISSSKEKFAMSVSYKSSDSQKSGIVISNGLINELHGDLLIPSIEFVLGHETGHIKQNHEPTSNFMESFNQERTADFYGYMNLDRQGYSIEIIEKAISNVMDVAHQNAPPSAKEMLKLRESAIGQVIQNSKELAENVKFNRRNTELAAY